MPVPLTVFYSHMVHVDPQYSIDPQYICCSMTAEKMLFCDTWWTTLTGLFCSFAAAASRPEKACSGKMTQLLLYTKLNCNEIT